MNDITIMKIICSSKSTQSQKLFSSKHLFIIRHYIIFLFNLLKLQSGQAWCSQFLRCKDYGKVQFAPITRYSAVNFAEKGAYYDFFLLVPERYTVHTD